MAEITMNDCAVINNYALGEIGELYAMRLLRGLGYRVRRYHHKGYDLIATNLTTGDRLRIEVKTARKHSDGKWRFTTIKNDKYGRTNSAHSDIVICLQWWEASFTPYLIPIADILGKVSICVTSNPIRYAGKYRQYQHNWDNLVQAA